MSEVKPEQARRFDYIRYDDDHAELQSQFYLAFNEMNDAIENNLENGRAKALAITKLEECYMWVGKQIRDQQVKKSGESKNLNERG